MKKRLMTQIPVQITLILLACPSVGFIALIFSAIAGGVTVSISPDSGFGLVEGIVCPEGAKIEVREGQSTQYYDSDGVHYATDLFISCIAEDGERYGDMEARALVSLLGVFFLVCFVPLFIPIILIILIGTHKITGLFFKGQNTNHLLK